MSYFTATDVTLGAKLLEILFIVIGLILINTGVKNATDKTNPSPMGTALFWCILGVVVAFGRWIPVKVVGVLVILMALPPILGKVKPGENEVADQEYVNRISDKLGYKIFIPAFLIGICAVGFALFTELGALVGVGVCVNAVTRSDRRRAMSRIQS